MKKKSMNYFLKERKGRKTCKGKGISWNKKSVKIGTEVQGISMGLLETAGDVFLKFRFFLFFFNVAISG